jgi:hypothetical protein
MKASSKVLISVLALVLVAGFFSVKEDREYMNKIKSGELIVECNFQDRGWDYVDPSRIQSFDDTTGTFYFNNGSSSTCRVTKSGE